MFNVLPSVPESVIVFVTANVFRFVIVTVPVDAVRVSPLTVVGVIAPSVSVITGVVVAVATVPETPFALVTETLVTVPLPPVCVKLSATIVMESGFSVTVTVFVISVVESVMPFVS